MSPLLLRTLLLHSALGLLVAGPLAVFAAPPIKKPTFDTTYGLLKTRNIFDPQRQPGATAAATPPPTSQSDYAALTGTLITAEKTLAFFSGSRPEFNAVLGLRSAIAGATITRITPDAIEIERNGKTVTVAVGQTVPLDAASAPTAAPAAPAASASTSATPPSPGAAPASAPAPADREALIRRMMEKRQQELR